MKKSTHILIVEDTAADAELAKRVIRKVLKACDFQVVETRQDFLKALETFQPDVILSDYALPSFDGLTALKLVLKHAPLTPLIIWTGSSSEDVAVDCMKAGANNYVLKENLKRLGPAILRALEEKALLVASKQAEEALQASEKRFRALIENGLDNISLLAADGTLLWESPSSIRTLNYAPNQHLGLSIFDELMHPDDLQWTRDLFTKLVQEPGSRSHTVFRLRHADGTWHWVEAIVTNLLHEPGIHAIVANYRDVNDQKQAEAEVRRSQTKYESLVETSHDLIWSVDAEGKFTFLNRAAREIYGYEPEELIGHSFFEVMDPEHYHRDAIKFRETIASVNELREVETYVRHRDGRPFILSANSVVIRENGNVIGVTGSSRDITARQQSEKALRESEQRYRALFEDMPIAIWEQDFSQVKKYLEALKQQGVTDFQTYFAAHSDALLECAGKIRILNVNHAAVHMYEAESKEQLIEWTDQDLSKGETEHLPEVFADIAEGRTGNAWEGEEETLTGRPIEISVNWSVTPDNQDDRLRVIVTTLDITERKQAGARISDLLAFNEKILNHSSVGILTFKVTGQCVLVNAKAASIVGASIPQLLAQNFRTIPAWRESGLYDLAEKAITTQAPVTADLHHVSTFGKDVWMTVHCLTFKSKDEDHLLLSISDITERKRVEEALRNSESKYRTLAENSLQGIAIYQGQKIVYANPAMCQINGYTVEELIGMSAEQVMALTHPDDRDLVAERAQKRIAGETLSPEIEGRILRKDGTTAWVQSFNNLIEYEGKPALLSTMIDITERRRAEEALRESENRLIMALSGAQMSVWEWDLQNNHILWSPEFFELTGIEEDGFDGTFEALTDLVHADDVERLMVAAEKAVAEKTLFAEEFRITRPDGETRWLSNLGHAEYDSTRDHLRLIGTVQDITQRKQAEIERQALLEIMQGLAITRDLPELLELIHHSIANVIYARNFFVVLYDESSGLFEEIYSVDQYDPPATPSKLEKSITSYVFRSGEPLLLTRALFDELAAQGEVELVSTDSASWLGVPLKTSGRTIGVMVVQDHENANRYSQRDRDFLASIATQISLTIEHREAGMELHQKNDDLGLLNAINEAVVRGQDLDSIVELLAKELSRIFSTQGNTIYSTIFMLTPDKQSIRMQRYFFSSETARKIEKLMGFRIPTIEIPLQEGGHFHRALTSRQSTMTSGSEAIQGWMAEFTETSSLHPLARATARKLIPQIYKVLKIQSAIAVPLISGEEIIGFLDVSSSGLFTANDVKRIETIGGQLTAVIQRQQANEKILRSEQFLQSIQNALSASVAILNETGTIVQINSAWREFGEQNGLAHPESAVGLNYLDICDSAAGPHAEEAPLVAQSIRAVIAGQRSEARIEYPCHSPDVDRWFTMHITKFEDGDHVWVVLAHEDITERKKAEEKLQASEARYRLATQATKDVIWEWTLEHNQLIWTENAQLVFGYSPQEIGPSALWWDEHIHPQDRERVISKLTAWTATGEGKSDWSDEYRLRLKDGSYAYVDDHAYLERDPAGRTIRMIGAMSNITERKRAEAAEREQRTLAEALRDTAETLNSTLDYGEVLDRILAAVGRVVPHEAATIMLIDGEVARVVRSQGYEERGFKNDVMQIKLPLADTDNLREMLETGQPVVVSDTRSYPGWKRLKTTDWLCSNVGAPITINGEVIGFILLDSSTYGFFTAVHGERLEAFANQAALAIHNARLLQQAQEEIAERKRAEQALIESMDQFRSLFEASPEAIMLLDPLNNWSIIDCNPAGCLMNGYQREELVGQSIDILNRTPGTAEERTEYLERVRQHGILRYETAHRHKDGSILTVEVSTCLIKVGTRDVVLGIDRDITARKQAEELLRAERRKAEKYLEIAGVMLLVLDTEGTVTLINQKGCEILGYSAHEIIGKNWIETFLPKAIREELQEVFHKLIADDIHGAAYYENSILTKSGEERLIAWHNTLLRDEQGRIISSISSGEDITVRKWAEEELRSSEERFRQLADNIQEVFWMTDAESGEAIYISPAAEKVWEQPVERLPLEPDTFIKIVFPDDQPLVLQNIEKEKSGEKVEMEYRVIRPDGSLRWVWDRAFPIFDGSGRVKRIAGITADITERKEAAEKLRESEDRYHSLFQNQMHGAALHEIITNDQGQPVDYIFLKVNPAFEKMTGLNAEEIVGRKVTEVLPGIENDEFIQIYGRVALTGESTHITEYSTPLGKYYEINAYSTGPRQFAVSFMDVTERKESELALVKSQSRYRELFDSSPISIWEEDFSLVKERVDSLLESGVTDLRQFFSDHPEMTRELASLVKIIDVNQASLELYGVDRKEDLLTSLSDLMDQGSTQHFEEEILSLISPLKRFSWEGTDVTRDGRQIEVLISGSIPHGYEEDWSKLIVSIIDITDRKHAEEEIRRRAGETSALLETSLALTNLDLKVALHTISQSAKNLFAADGCRIFLMEPNGEELRCVLALQENTAAFTNLKVKIGEGVTGTVAASGRGEIVNEMQNDPRSIQVPGTLEEDEAIMFAPLRERDQTVGVLSIRRAGSNRPFQPADLELLKALASMAASAVSNARLFEEAQRRLTELEALYENGLAVGRLLKPNEIGERVINTIARNLQWHHVTIRLRREGSDNLELVAFSLPDLKEEKKGDAEQRFLALVNKVGQGLSGWVIQTGLPFRTGNVHAHPQYVDTQAGIQSGLYMPLRVGESIIGVISVESETADAFSEQDERLLATLGNQAATAFENARLYQAIERELSERKRTEEALRSSEVHYRELANSITDILFELDEDLCYTHWNKASEMFSGISPEDAIGKSMTDVFGISEEQSQREKIYRSVLQEQQARTFETEVLARGQKRALEINAYPSARGISVVAKDVTDRKRSEIIMHKRFELMEYSAHYSLHELVQRTVDEVSELTESAIGFFHFMGEDQNTLRSQTWSTNALRLFDVPVSEGTHRELDRAGVWAEAVRQRRPLIQNDYESLAEKKGLPQGHVPLVREIVIPILRNEKVMAVMGIGNKPQDYTLHDLEIAERLADYAWDITERKQMQEALENERNQLAQHVEERTADLSRANSNLARALRVKDEFLANMSHELRTPLNAILGLSESLGEQIAGPLNEKQQKYITTIGESGHHLLSLINDILDLAKIEAGQITLDINKMDIHSVCQASLRMIKQLAQKKNQEVLVDIQDNLGWMWADERRLKQMIVNLLSNAVKFTPENEKIGLQVQGDEEANKITITVWDNGIGIKEDDLTRLFQPFIQLDSGLAREATGTGLGLALVAQMARLHGGSVSAVSDPGKGSRFSIILPWEPALAIDTASRLRTTSKFRAIKPDETNKPTILLVEDTKEVIMMVRDYLELAGYTVVTAQDGVDALVQARHARPDLILMDVQMPRMDGLEATRKLRSEPDFKHTPIIALTALAMPSDRERCLAAGMDEYVSKPINLKALMRIIQGCLFDPAESKPG